MRTTQLCALLAALALLGTVHADVYMHMMRGSNNRLKAEGENTENQNRLFNSQNNAKGGYNVGADQPEEYYVGSEMLLEWTPQHGCNNPNDECEVIIQYMCTDQNNHYYRNPNIRDGTTEETPPETGGGPAYGEHESNQYYKDCKARQRNEGLVTLDRRRFYGKEFYNAQYTRQNENGNRRGYECQEERDYYPYWHPTPWRDIAILIDDWRFTKFCPFYEAATENVLGRGYCTNPVHNNEQACEEGRFYYPQDQAQLDRERELQRQQANVAFWTLRIQQTPGDQGAQQQLTQAQQQVQQLTGEVAGYHNQRKGQWKTSTPLDPENKHPLRCRPMHPGGPNPSSRDNHLGNTGAGQAPSFLWKIPDTPAEACVLRLRYNMSSTDYPSWRTWSEHNGDKSPIFQEMEVPVGTFGKVRLAINTNQIARTFQDRSHVFKIKRRDGNLNGARIINFNVRGKRGNIVQAYPAVEYDYHPNRAQICAGDYVHFQWTGSNTNPRNYAGQGTAGTDRHNIVQMGKKTADGYNWKADNFQMNKPLAFGEVDMFDDHFGKGTSEAAAAIKKFALLGQTDDLLNDASSYFNFPPIQYKTAGKTYHFMCTRNNNFSNRSQKGFINVNTCASRTPSQLPELQPGAVMEDIDDNDTRYDGFAKKYGHGL